LQLLPGFADVDGKGHKRIHCPSQPPSQGVRQQGIAHCSRPLIKRSPDQSFFFLEKNQKKFYSEMLLILLLSLATARYVTPFGHMDKPPAVFASGTCNFFFGCFFELLFSLIFSSD
jgi:hypothetical protein